MNKRLLVLLAACLAFILSSAVPVPAQATPALFLRNGGCTVFYAADGQTVLGGNNEDFVNPFTQVWFIPASQGHYGRVYFGYDDFIPQGGLNDQGVFFDELGLPYKDMPLAKQRPRYPGSLLTPVDQALSTSANVEEVISFYNRWYFSGGGEYTQLLFGDRYGSSVILDGDTVLRKQGAFQLATNFRLVDQPNPPAGEPADDFGYWRYHTAYDMLSKAEHFSVDLFRQVLDATHQEGASPTLYSQVYELKTGIIHLYLYHDFQQEVALNLADELAKGPHVITIASLFPKNPDLEEWTLTQGEQWKASYQANIAEEIEPASLSWMSGEYMIQEEPETSPVKVYLENNQLYLQKSGQPHIELYPTSPDTVFHHFFNGFDLVLTFQRGGQGEAVGAQGSFGYEPYNIVQPYHLNRAAASHAAMLPFAIAGAVLALVLVGGMLWWIWKQKGRRAV